MLRLNFSGAACLDRERHWADHFGGDGVDECEPKSELSNAGESRDRDYALVLGSYCGFDGCIVVYASEEGYGSGECPPRGNFEKV